MRNQIIEEGEEYIKAFYEKTKLNVETNKTNNREKEKVWVFIQQTLKIINQSQKCISNPYPNTFFHHSEQLSLASQEKFHKEADKHYWKSIAELVPNEVAHIEKRGKKKDQDKKPSITVVQGPKPGKPTDLSRMRGILVKLKHKPPPHMLPPPPAPAAKDGKDAKDGKNKKDVKETNEKPTSSTKEAVDESASTGTAAAAATATEVSEEATATAPAPADEEPSS